MLTYLCEHLLHQAVKNKCILHIHLHFLLIHSRALIAMPITFNGISTGHCMAVEPAANIYHSLGALYFNIGRLEVVKMVLG